MERISPTISPHASNNEAVDDKAANDKAASFVLEEQLQNTDVLVVEEEQHIIFSDTI